jgi:hypothetical protein
VKSITSVIYGVFAAEGTITALVAANNIMSAPADLSVATFPLITFSEENRNTDILITGQPSGLVESTLVIQCAGKTPQSALAVAEVVNTFLNGKTASAIGSLYCVMCYNTGSSDGFDDDAQAHIVTLTYAITYR